LEFREHTLENGLEIVAECNGQAYSTALGFFVKTGARDETDAVAGVSHFLEHMAFKGTPTRTADDVNREFDEMGADYNAGTGEEGTVYYAAVLPEYQERAVELLADILRPSLRPEDFDTEKQVIVEEIRMHEDQPPFGAEEKCRAAHYGPHPLGRSVYGTVESITGLTVEAMRGYFRRRYSPGNIAVVGTGRIDFDALVSAVRRCSGHWEPFEAGRACRPVAPAQGFLVVQKGSAVQQYAVEMANGPPATDDGDRYAASLLATILGDDTGSRFYWELVDPGLAEHASLGHWEYEDTGLYMTQLSCEPDRAAENLQRILDIYRQAEREGVAQDELAQAKSKLSSRIVLSGERPRSRLFAVGAEWVQRREYRSIRDVLDAVDAVTRDGVAQVLARYPLSRSTTVTIGPLADVPAPT
jgi:predicted Zn-dependent peptidase